jgi:DNA-binding MltR family transcriptional regulator
MWIHQSSPGTISAAFEEMQGSSDRAAGIVASAIVEDHLTTALKSRFHHDEPMIRELFKGTGPLAPFSTKIKLAFLLGLLSARACKDLQTIRRIRNDFAHKLDKTFETQNIKDMAMNLTVPDWYNVTFSMPNIDNNEKEQELILIDEETKATLDKPRQRYLATCRCFLAFFTVEPPIVPPTPRF